MRYPDRPKNTVYGLSAALAMEDSVANALWIMQPKFDGFSAVIEYDTNGHITMTSRHGKPIDASDAMIASVAEFMLLCDMPTNSVFHGEWMGRRTSCNIERLAIFDMMQVDGSSLWSAPAIIRLRRLLEFTKAVDPVLMAETWPDGLNQDGRTWNGDRQVIVSPSRIDHFLDSIRQWKDTMPYCEGVVFKEQQSRHIGSVRSSADNPFWTRLRWRGGEDGMTEHDL